MAAAAQLHPEVDALLEAYPDIKAKLDAAVLQLLQRAAPERAVEILEELIFEKTDVRNPSAFLATALRKFPQKRGRPADLDELLEQHPDIDAALDEPAKNKLREADISRATEIIEDIVQKGDVRNPSAFVNKALQRFPHKRGVTADPQQMAMYGQIEETDERVEAMLARHPRIYQALDEAALKRLRKTDPERAVEIIQDLIGKDDIHNPSAYVVKAITAFPQKRGHQSDPLGDILQRHQHIRGALDDTAMQKLQEADPSRAVEVIHDLVAKTDVRNPSAFVATALHMYPQPRGNPAREMPMQPVGFMPMWGPMLMAPPPHPFAAAGRDQLEQVLQANPEVYEELDRQALDLLSNADPGRAIELVMDIAQKGDVRNPSAFVAHALNKHPQQRGRQEQAHQQMQRATFVPTGRPSRGGASLGPVDQALQRYPHIAAGLDPGALKTLQTADPERAVEVIQEMAAKGDVRNPSAFAVKSLTTFPMKRGMTSSVESLDGVDGLLKRHPAIEAALDDAAVSKLQAADPARALEIIEDVAAKPNIVNISAFVVKALREHPQKRSLNEPNVPLAFLPKRPRTD